MTLPWAAWFQDETIKLTFPAGVRVDVLHPRGGNPVDGEACCRALDRPLGTPPFAELAKGRRSACIVVDDLARPTRAAGVLDAMTTQLQEAGIPAEQIEIVVATGSHGALSAGEVEWKVGSNVAARFPVQSHDCRSRLARTGITYGDNELQVNQTFAEADLKIAVGSVLPHSFAGYSGGAKLVLPGLADLSSIARSHKFVQLGLRGGQGVGDNRFRTEAEEIAKTLGLEFVVCLVTNSKRETIGIFAGDVVDAHRAACESARSAFATPLTRTYECAVLNAYPKDLDLVQAANVFVAWKTARQPVTRDDGLVVLATAASAGVGHHGLFSPGGVSHHSPRPLRHLRGRDLWLYAPTLTDGEIHSLFWEGYPVFRNQCQLLQALETRLAPDSSVAVFPCAPAQQVDDQR